jgi:hypothetical protein
MKMVSLREIACAALALVASTALAWAEPVAQVVKLNGQAVVTRGNATAPLVLGAALEPGDRVTTDADARLRLQLIDGSVINLGSQSTFAIDDVVSGGPGTERQVGLDLFGGALRAFAAPATPNSRFEIRTPKAITAVRGTEWGILSDEAKSDVLILSGRVGVRKNEVSGISAISITGGRGVTVSDAGLGQITRSTPDQVAALLAATDVPGPERGFDLGNAPALNFAEAAPVNPGAGPEAPRKKSHIRCFQESGSSCGGRGADGRGSTSGGNKSHDSSHDSGHDNGND